MDAWARSDARVRNAFRAVDHLDWEYLLSRLGDGGRDRFWKAVIKEARDAMKPDDAH